jgi:copper chaperone NosL
MSNKTIFVRFFALSVSLVAIFGCEQQSQQQMLQQAVAIESADECHQCGMLILGFEGPKGELVESAQFTGKQKPPVRKFCSTRDLFAYYFDPEHQRNITQLFVHDMSKTPWEHPNDDYFIDAKMAWYVVGSEKMGAMGKTIASFSIQADAVAFAEQYHGKVKSFKQLSLADLQ